ncbi:uncharacterized protein LOC8036032 isoform X2 [Ixodes scapularis]|uniref:uncharacterized protein LOC8036032 isoform X2 n=1 Tax=Ixodes scapularis TaxID=6945 RepID=UPI001C3874BB|nr:uncharacterized protein LOC8036032 isoform X2 [Ixodes scapularis]
MCDPRTVIEGSLKYRDGRKWKSRWCVVSKLSPVADCIHVQLYRDSRERCKSGPTKASLSLAGCLGLEAGFTLDKESHTLALICPDLVLALAFDSRELLIQWQVKIRANVAEVQQFLVQIWHSPGRAKLASGPARLHLQDHLFCLTSGIPPRLLGTWPLKELRRFGLVDGKFCFEGGSKCGKGEGLHVLHTNQTEELAEAFEAASRGKLASRKKLPCKPSVLETPSRMSLQPRARAQDSSQCCSSESRQPLLGSSCSDAGSCDACSEIVRFASDAQLSDDVFRSRTFCKVHYRWPSCVSHCGHAASVSSSEAESADTVSLTISDIQETPPSAKEMVPDTTLPMNPTPANGSAPAVWTYTHCGKCGRHYCARCSYGSHSSQSGKSPDGSKGFAPHWTMDLRVAPSQASDAAVHSRLSGVGSMAGCAHLPKPSDRSSVCSQSSGTSSASTSGASTSSSEYNVPRSFLESLYDQPRNIIHTDSELFRVRPSSSGATPSPMVDLPAGIHQSMLPCPCTSRSSQPRVDSGITRSSSGSSDSPLGSPKRLTQAAFFPAPVAKPLNSPVPCQTPKSACTCGLRPLAQYLNYDVPRAALAKLYLREKQGQRSSFEGTADPKGNDLPTTPGQQYDVPKKFKEQLIQQECQASGRAGCVLPVACNCGGGLLSEPLPTCHEPCTCRRVACWAGSLVPCLRRTANCGEDSHPAQVVPLNCPTAPATICKEPGKKAECGSLQTPFVSAEQLTMDHKFPEDPCSNYANCQFIESLSLYQNTCGLSLAVQQPENEKTLEVVKEQKASAGTKTCEASPLHGSKSLESTADNAGSLKRPKVKSSPSNSSGESYEVMSFRNASDYRLTVVCDGNYVAMRPIEPCKCDNENRSASVSRSENQDTKRTPLPLRPFMPYLLPCEEEFVEEASSDEPGWKAAEGSRARFFKNGWSNGGKSSQTKPSALSNSLGDLKRKVLTKRRSNSADGRQESAELSETEDYPVASPTRACQSKERRSALSKLPLRSRERSGNHPVDVTPPSSVPSTPNNRSMENLFRIPFHRSADCLKLKGDFHFSEEDLSANGRETSDTRDIPSAGSSIKRSSSVPCKPQPLDQISSPSDSGVSTSLPESSETVCELAAHDGILLTGIHSSLPTRLDEGPGSTPGHRMCDNMRKCTHIQEAFARCPQQQQLQYALLGNVGPAIGKTCSGGSSTTSSDSDYIETLSLCSSGSNGSGSEYVRCCDDCKATPACPAVSCALKPRSAKEYNSVDRSGVRPEGEEERYAAHVLACHRAHHHAPIHLTLPKASSSSRGSPAKQAFTSSSSVGCGSASDLASLT